MDRLIDLLFSRAGQCVPACLVVLFCSVLIQGGYFPFSPLTSRQVLVVVFGTSRLSMAQDRAGSVSADES